MKQILTLLLAALLALPLAPALAEEAEVETWDIWGEQMATEPEAADYDFEKAFDPADFRPTLTPHLLADQSAAKGNVIVCSGGGDRARSNSGEGVPTCEYLNEIGYNAYLLDYRVSPYRSGTMTLDVQRAVRYLKHNAQSLGIGSIENLGLMGFSAGAMHCYGVGIAFGGDITPDSVYPDYVCDEVDAESADVDVVVCVYAAGMAHDTKAEPVDISEPVLLLGRGRPQRPRGAPGLLLRRRLRALRLGLLRAGVPAPQSADHLRAAHVRRHQRPLRPGRPLRRRRSDARPARSLPGLPVRLPRPQAEEGLRQGRGGARNLRPSQSGLR